MEIYQEDLNKLLLAVLVGGMVGAKREHRNKDAGLRTIIFICFGSTLFTIISTRMGSPDDTVRIAASIVAGVGLLGAGVFMRGTKRIKGLTAASTIWLAAVLGMGIGGGYYGLIAFDSLVALVILSLFPILERYIDKGNETRAYEITCPLDENIFRDINATFKESSLKIMDQKRMRSKEAILCEWKNSGKPLDHKKLAETLYYHPQVRELRMV